MVNLSECFKSLVGFMGENLVVGLLSGARAASLSPGSVRPETELLSDTAKACMSDPPAKTVEAALAVTTLTRRRVFFQRFGSRPFFQMFGSTLSVIGLRVRV